MKKHSSKVKRLTTAALMLLLSTSMLASSTYAWFTMNKEVELTNITLQVKTSSNLLISETNQDDSTFIPKLTEDRYALLEPASTVDGINYFYTLDGAADGHKVHGPEAPDTYDTYNENTALTTADTDADKTKYDADFNSRYGITTANTAGQFKTAYGYFDYTFYLKGVSIADGQKIVMDKCNLLYDGAPVTEKAWRVAVLSQETTSGTEPTTPGTLFTILPIDGAEYQTDGEAVNAPDGTGAVSNYQDEAILATLSASDIKYYKVVVRCWIEGEDKTCTTENFGTKTDNYTLELGFSIEDGATPATVITSTVS